MRCNSIVRHGFLTGLVACAIALGYPSATYANNNAALSLKYPTQTQTLASQANAPLWVNHGQLNAAGTAWLSLLRDHEMLSPYYLPVLQNELDTLSDNNATRVDELLTDALIDYLIITLNQTSFTHPASTEDTPVVYIEQRWGNRKITAADSVTFIDYYQKNGGLENFISLLTPKHAYYQSLHMMLPILDNLISASEWQAFPKKGPNEIRKGETHPDIAILRHNLQILGDLEKNSSESSTPETHTTDVAFFDEPLEAALKKFQSRHGIEPTGVIGSRTRSALAISPEQRKHQILQNMKRWRELPADLGNTYIMVNIPDFSFNLVKDKQSALQMKTVVGKPQNPTPRLISKVTNIVFNPSWNVPHDIARKELLPDVKKDPTYLTKNHYNVYVGWDDATLVDPATVDWSQVSANQFPYRFEQTPGDHNALGYIKFNFPNEHSVYMHDTASRKYFSRPYRALSHGCVRLEKPVELAEALLSTQTPAWDKAKVEKAMAGKDNAYTKLDNTTPVYFAYWTAWQDTDGTLQFRSDLYDIEGLSRLPH